MRTAIVVVAALVAAGCSSSGPASTEVDVTTPTTTVTPSDSVPASTTVPSDERAPVVDESVRIDVDVDGTTGELTGTIAGSEDPFGSFASCSGLRGVFGTYSVLVSASTGPVRSIGLGSNDPVPGAGVFEAAVRVEFADEPAIDATGTVALDADLRSGSYVAFAADGAEVGGTFDCDAGDAPPPSPLELGVVDGVLEAVEVFALLRAGDAERFVGLAVVPDGTASVECPGVVDGATGGDLVVRVDGDDDTGAITFFELEGGSAPTLHLRVGSADYEFDAVRRDDGDDPTAGTFNASTSEVEIDGAFRCS